MIDFKKFNIQKTSTRIHPRDIFMGLNKRDKKYEYPRDVQTQVWDKWFENRDNKNTIIKMNTGSGKTVVALLVLQSCINEGKGTAVYVVPNKYLIEQVKFQASLLGINITTEDDDLDFLQAKSILVICTEKLVNGKTHFGITRKIRIDNIIIDDVHACLSSIEKQFIIEIPNDKQEYKAVLSIFESCLIQYNSNQYAEILEKKDSDVSMLVPFWNWQNNINEVKSILSKSKIDEIVFSYPLIANDLELSRCFVSPNKIQIIPFSIPIDIISSFKNANRRIFFSATLPDDSVFSTVLNIMPEEMGEIITPISADDIGDRMILFPTAINKNISENDLKLKIKEQSETKNVIVLTPSFRRANFWLDVDAIILDAESIKQGIENIKKSNNGLYVIVNRYDGIDLPDDACRLLVIDGVPPIYNYYDRYEATILTNGERMKSELIQKIEQGMGRGTRSGSDYCAVILMGNGLNDLVLSKDGLLYFSEATRIQISLAQEMWSELKNGQLDDIMNNLNIFYDRDDGWLEYSKDALINIKYSNKKNINQKLLAIRKAYNYAERRQYDKAVNQLTIISNSEEISKEEKGLFKMFIAEYVNFYNNSEAQEILLSANSCNKHIIKPIQGIQFKKIQANNLNQAEQIIDYINSNNYNSSDLILKISKICEDLSFNSGHKTFECAIKELGLFLGFNSIRPELEYNDGPDNFWMIQGNEYFVIECKNESNSEKISKDDCSQLLNSINWFEENYKDSYKKVTPIIIHKSFTFDKIAYPDERTKVLTEELLQKLKTALISFATGLASSNVFKNKIEINKLLIQNNFMANDFIRTFTKDYGKK